MSRSVLCPAAAVLALSGCAGAPVVRTEVVEITCPSVAPPEWAVAVPQAPDDLRAYPEALEAVRGSVAAQAARSAAYRTAWQACPKP